MSFHQVVVVGGGPAGATSAGLLARRGYDVALLDRATFPRDKACAEYCSPGVESGLRRIGAWDLIESEGPRRLNGMQLYVEGAQALRVAYDVGGHAAFSFSLPRCRFDDALLRYAARSGAKVLEGRRVRNVTVDRDGVFVETTSRAGSTETFSSRVVVGADGMHSQVARALGVRSRSHWPRRLGLIAHYDEVPGFDDWGEMHVGKEIYCGLNPLPDGLLNVGLVVPLNYGHRIGAGVEKLFEQSIARLPRVAARLSQGRRVKAIRGVGPMSRRVSPVSGRGFLLVGDAAGFLDPFTGEGIYRSICGAEIAARAIDEALKAATAPGKERQAKHPLDVSGYVEVRRREFVAKERLTWIIQAALSVPPALAWLCSRASSSGEAQRMLGNVLGDSVPATRLLRPDVVGGLLKPW